MLQILLHYICRYPSHGLSFQRIMLVVSDTKRSNETRMKCEMRASNRNFRHNFLFFYFDFSQFHGKFLVFALYTIHTFRDIFLLLFTLLFITFLFLRFPFSFLLASTLLCYSSSSTAMEASLSFHSGFVVGENCCYFLHKTHHHD